MVIFNEAKPKYDRLDDILSTNIHQNIKFTNVITIIIDLKEIVRKFFRPDLVETIRVNQVEEIASDLIAVVGHWRNYFYKKGKYTNFFILYSFEKCNTILEDVPNYKKEYYDEYFDKSNPKYELVKRAAQAATKVMNYLPNVTFVETSKYDELAYAKFIISLKMKNEPVIILSNDDIFYQLISQNVFVVTIKGIKSQLVTEANVYNELIDYNHQFNLASKYIPLVLAIGGTKRYSYKTLPKVALIKAADIVSKLLEKGKINEGETIRMPIIEEELDEKNKMEKMIKDNYKLIEDNYYFIKNDNILYSHKLDIKNDTFAPSAKCTARSLMQLNDQIFKTFPLQLEMLVRGEKI